MKTFGLIMMGVLMTFSSLSFAQAPRQSSCGQYVEIRKQLIKKYGEQPIAGGLNKAGRMTQVFAREDGKSWTIIVVYPDGMACVASAGKDWETTPYVSKGPMA